MLPRGQIRYAFCSGDVFGGRESQRFMVGHKAIAVTHQHANA